MENITIPLAALSQRSRKALLAILQVELYNNYGRKEFEELNKATETLSKSIGGDTK